MTGQLECVYPDNEVEDGIHPSPRQGSNPRFLYRVAGPLICRWYNRVVNCEVHLVMKLTGTEVCKTISHIFQRCSFFVFGVRCHVMTYCVSLDIRGKW